MMVGMPGVGRAALLLLLLLQLAGGGAGLDLESVGQKIIKKLASAFEKSVIRAGNTCGLPKINNVMKNLTLHERETARFECSVDMKCMVSYIQWYHETFNGSTRLLRTGATMGNPYIYVIKDVAWQDEGFYSCVAGNTLGETISTATLMLSGFPRLAASSGLLLLLLTFTAVLSNRLVADTAHR